MGPTRFSGQKNCFTISPCAEILFNSFNKKDVTATQKDVIFPPKVQEQMSLTFGKHALRRGHMRLTSEMCTSRRERLPLTVEIALRRGRLPLTVEIALRRGRLPLTVEIALRRGRLPLTVEIALRRGRVFHFGNRTAGCLLKLTLTSS